MRTFAAHINKTYGLSGCIGIAWLFDGEFDEISGKITSAAIPQLSSLNINSICADLFPHIPFFLISHPYAAAQTVKNDCRNYLYLHIGEKDISGTAVVNNTPVCGDTGNRFAPGNLLQNGIDFNSKLRLARSIEEEAAIIAELIRQFRIVIPFDEVFIELSSYSSEEEFVEMVQSALSEHRRNSENITANLLNDTECRVKEFAAQTVRTYFAAERLRHFSKQ